MRKVALITGITGQDGSYLAEFLIEKGYEVHGILRRSSSFNTGRIEHLYLDEWVRDMKKSRLVNLHWGDMTDSSSLIRIISDIHPTEIYNLAAQSHVKVSFDVPEYTAEADAIGTLRLLEAVRICGLDKTCRIYQASTSELFGKVQEIPQKETTPFYPRSPYGVAKQYGFWITKNYRESYGMFAVNGTLFSFQRRRLSRFCRNDREHRRGGNVAFEAARRNGACSGSGASVYGQSAGHVQFLQRKVRYILPYARLHGRRRRAGRKTGHPRLRTHARIASQREGKGYNSKNIGG